MKSVHSHVELLEWDTQFFGYNIAKLLRTELNENIWTSVVQECRSSNIHCLYCELNMNPINTAIAEAENFTLVDIRLKLNIDLTKYPGDLNANSLIREATLTDLPILESISRKTSRVSRFYYDRKFPKDKVEEMYAIWIKKSLLYSFICDAVYVAVQEMQDIPVGFITIKISEAGKGLIVLVGVDEDFKSLQYGMMLTKAALLWFKIHHVDNVSVITQGYNLQAQRMYQNIGFKTELLRLYYHKWFC